MELIHLEIIPAPSEPLSVDGELEPNHLTEGAVGRVLAWNPLGIGYGQRTRNCGYDQVRVKQSNRCLPRIQIKPGSWDLLAHGAPICQH
jgi:hypothetical protein